MFRSLHLKLVLILVLLMISIMAVVGTFLINSVSVYHLDEFSNQMLSAFSENTEFVSSLRNAAKEEDGASALFDVMRAYSGNLSIDMYNRNFYILNGTTGECLLGSDENSGEQLDLTPNILSAIEGEPGYSRAITASYIDVAIPIEGGGNEYIIYVYDSKSRVQSLTTEMFMIIMESLLFGLVISFLLSFLLSKTMTTPIEGLISSAGALARGEFSGRIKSHSTDEIGVLTQTFNDMADTLQKTLETVQNERNKLNTLFARMTDGVCAFDRNGDIIQMNGAAERLLGRSYRDDITYSELFENAYAWSQTPKLQAPGYFETELERDTLSLQLYIVPFGEGSRESGIMVVIHDITEQMKLEHSRREFVANVSHELRTPLTNVKSYAETLLENDDIDRETEESFLGVIMSETDRMTRIVSDLLTLSHFDYGNTNLNMRPNSITKIIERVYEAMYMDAKNHSHQLILELKEELPEVVCDSDRIEQVIVNIVSNSIKYTPDGGEITISAGAENGWVLLKIKDNGIGIPEEDIGHLFERFYRVDKARSRAAGGSGLGLSIAKEIIERHGGRIDISSVYGTGTEVTIRLPAASPERESGR